MRRLVICLVLGLFGCGRGADPLAKYIFVKDPAIRLPNSSADYCGTTFLIHGGAVFWVNISKGVVSELAPGKYRYQGCKVRVDEAAVEECYGWSCSDGLIEL